MHTNIEKSRFRYAIIISSIIALAMLLVHLFQVELRLNFTAGGVYPLKIDGLIGIITHPMIHKDWTHLLRNLLSIWILCNFICYFYATIDLKVLTLCYLCTGILLWFIGRPTYHIGASGWVYALSSFLFFSGIMRQYIPLIAVSLIVAIQYGSNFWYMFPWEKTQELSWEGHLAGGIVGCIIAIIYRKKGPQKPLVQDTEEEQESSWYDQSNTTEE